MDDCYKRFLELLEKNKLTAYKVHQATGIATATLSDWKTGKSTPKDDKMRKIAEFLGVSYEYLKTGRSEIENKKYLVETAELNAKINKDPQAQRVLEYFLKMNKVQKDTVEQMMKGLFIEEPEKKE